MLATSLRCPVQTAQTICSDGKLIVGWSAARATPGYPRRMRSFRCLEPGHPSSHCTSNRDYSNTCYRCGKTGHVSSSCEAPLRCVICFDKEIPSDHYLGGPQCGKDKKKPKSDLLGKTSLKRTAPETTTEKEHQISETGYPNSEITPNGISNDVDP